MFLYLDVIFMKCVNYVEHRFTTRSSPLGGCTAWLYRRFGRRYHLFFPGSSGVCVCVCVCAPMSPTQTASAQNQLRHFVSRMYLDVIFMKCVNYVEHRFTTRSSLLGGCTAWLYRRFGRRYHLFFPGSSGVCVCVCVCADVSHTDSICTEPIKALRF